MVLENGEKIVLFKSLEPYETPSAVERLCEEYNKSYGEGPESIRKTFQTNRRICT